MSTPDFTELRRQMVTGQIVSRGITDKRVIKTLLSVERHKFVPEGSMHLAYEDYPLSIGEGQFISQPYIVALMTELLALKGNEKILEIGTGSGYQAAVLSRLCRHVYTVEINSTLANRVEKLLKSIGYNNISARCADGYSGWQEHAPYDRIIITCAPEQVPEKLMEQLADSGLLAAPVGSDSQELKLIQKKAGGISEKNIIPVRFVPMVHKAEPEY